MRFLFCICIPAPFLQALRIVAAPTAALRSRVPSEGPEFLWWFLVWDAILMPNLFLASVS